MSELVTYPAGPPTLFGTDNPERIIHRVTEIAAPLAKAITERKLFVPINGRKYVRVEGWTLLGTMLGVYPVTVWTRLMLDGAGEPNGWEARVEARTRDGQVIGASEAMCSRDEDRWRNRDEHALRSMAQTRATSKALRQPLGFVMSLAGYEATPAEEMPAVGVSAAAAQDGDDA